MNHGPNQPRVPNNSTKTKPAITGDTVKGRSIREISKALPRNSNFVIAQAAATPKIALSGTEISTATAESFMADKVSGAETAAQNGAKPLANAMLSTASKGTTT